MEKKEIIENNKLIAHFMGYKPFDNGDARYSPNDWYCGEGVVYAQYKDLGYDRSWDWLMPAYFKFQERMGELLEAKYSSVKYSTQQSFFSGIDAGEIIICWYALLEGIKWYNHQPQQHELQGRKIY